MEWLEAGPNGRRDGWRGSRGGLKGVKGRLDGDADVQIQPKKGWRWVAKERYCKPVKGRWKRGHGSKGLKVGAIGGTRGGVHRSLEDCSAETVGARGTRCGERVKRVPMEGFDEVEEEEKGCNGCWMHVSEGFVCFCCS